MPTSPDQLIEELMANPDYASGARPFPRAISVPEVLALVRRVQAEVDLGVQAREEAASANGLQVACKRGCNACCTEPIMVLAPEALAVAAFLARPEGATAKARFLEAYPAWREAVGDSLERLSDLDLHDTAENKAAAHAAHRRRRLMCPFNHEGACQVYAVRPAICRNAHAVNTAELCGDHPSGELPTRVLFKPLEDFLLLGQWINQAAHLAIGAKPLRVTALPDLVYGLLARSGAIEPAP